MMECPLVTIAIPFCNTELFLSYAIRSVINQTYKNWELILIDDGSKDSSIEIADSFAKQDERIRIVVDGQNKGLATRLNETIQLAKGELYARMDADDIMAIGRIEEQVRYLNGHPEINVVGSSAMIIDADNRVIRSSDIGTERGRFIHPTVMGRTTWFRKFLYNPEFRRSQDVELWLRSRASECSYNITSPLLFYREFGIQTLQKNLSAHRAMRRIYKNYRIYGKSLEWAAKGVLYTRVQDVVYIIFSAFGRLDFLMSRRKRRALPKEMWLGQEDLEESIKQ